jgi:hypothetical protein
MQLYIYGEVLSERGFQIFRNLALEDVLNNLLYIVNVVDWSGGRRLQRE